MTTDGPTPSDRWAPPGSGTAEPPPAARPSTPSSPSGPQPSWPAPSAAAGFAPQWRSVHGVGVALQVLLWVALAFDVVLLAALANERNKVGDFESSFFAVDELQDAIDLVDGVVGFGVLLAIAIFVLFIIFCWRGAKNIELLGRYQPPLGAGWAIGSWFIPLASPILVAIVFAGIWKGSDPTIPPGVADWRRARLTALLPLWVVAWFVGATTTGVGRSAFTNDAGEFETLNDIRRANTTSLVGAFVVIAGVVLAAAFVRKLTARMDIWGEHLGFEGPAPSPYAAGPTTRDYPHQGTSAPPATSDESFARRDEPPSNPPPGPPS